MKYRCLAVAFVGLAVEQAEAIAQAGGGGGANWFLRSPDGSSQGPYGLSQLGEWSSAGYVSPDSQVQWGARGTPQPLSSVLGAGGGGGGGGGGAVGGASSEDGRRGDDETSEDGGYDYKAAASQLWGDDSEDEGSLISDRVTAVEGGRWSESVAAAKGTFKKLFTGGRKSENPRRQGNGGRGRGRGRGRGGRGGRGGRYPQGARGAGRRGGQAYSQGRHAPYGSSTGGGGPYGAGAGRGQEGRGAGSGQGIGGGGGGDWNSALSGVPGGSWQPSDPASSARHPQEQHPGGAGGAPTGAGPGVVRDQTGFPPPPPPSSSFSQELPPAQDSDSGGGGGGGGVPLPPISEDGVTGQLPPPPPPPGLDGYPPPPSLPPAGAGGDGSSGGARADGAVGFAPPNVPPPTPAAAAGAGAAPTGGLDPREIEAFYAAQEEYGGGGGGGGGPGAVDAKPRKRRGWGSRGRENLSKEDLTAMGLNYGDDDRDGAAGGGGGGGERTGGGGGWFRRRGKGRRGRVLGGRVSVDSMKLKYEEGWDAEADGEGVIAAVKSVMTAGRSLSRAVTSPGKTVTSTCTSVTPLAGVCLLARAGGFFPLLLWWSFSVTRGVLPVIMSWLLSRLMVQLADFSAGRYSLSPSHYQNSRLACFRLVGQQAAAGLSLAVATGAVRAWLRPRARERSAALCRRALAGVSVAGGKDRPPVAEFRELSFAPWDYMRQAMEFSRAAAGVAAVAAVLHTVWPLRGPVALGGGAAALLLLESLTLWLAGDSGSAQPLGDVVEELAGGIQGGAVASAEAETRGLRQVLLSKHSALLNAAEDSGRNERVLTIDRILKGSLMWLVMGACAVYAVVSVVEEELAYQFGTARVTLVITQVWLAYASLQSALNGLGQLASLRPPAARMHAMALTLAGPESGGGGKDLGSPGTTEGGWSNDGPEPSDGLRLQGVSFTPSGRSRQALSGVDLHAPAGSVVAVLGGAGAGKTALLQLALGSVKADAGEALFQGRPLQEWETGAFRERVAWLNQVSGRFALSAGENIGAGDASEFSNRELWARAAGLSGVSAAIESLPLGYDTLLEDGGGPAAGAGVGAGARSGLSEGEWQRLQLARFLMRADVAKLLLLDEPFKGVSPAESSRMLSALGAQARATGQVVLVASQDLSVGRWADAALFLEDGVVSEAGRWDDLLASGGSFAAAVRERDAF